MLTLIILFLKFLNLSVAAIQLVFQFFDFLIVLLISSLRLPWRGSLALSLSSIIRFLFCF